MTRQIATKQSVEQVSEGHFKFFSNRRGETYGKPALEPVMLKRPSIINLLGGIKNRDGFTLIELMVTVAVLSIAAAIAIPNTLIWVDNQRLGSAARELRSVLEEAKNAAIKEGTMAGVILTADSRKYQVYVDSGDNDGTFDTNDTELNQGTLDDGVTLSISTKGGADEFQFNRMGLTESDFSGTVKLSNARGRSYTIRVKTAGVIRVE